MQNNKQARYNGTSSLQWCRGLALALLLLLGSLGLAAPAHALVTFSSGVNTIDASSPIVDDVLVTNSAILNVVDGGTIDGNVTVINNSELNVVGGVITGDVTAANSARVTVSGSGGSIGGLDAYDSSTINVSGGEIRFSLHAFNSSMISISGGSTGALFAEGSSTVSMSGGSIHLLNALDSSVVSITGGGIRGPLTTVSAVGGSTVNVFGCNLLLSNPTPDSGGTRYSLTGILNDGREINELVFEGNPGQIVLNNKPAVISCPANQTVTATSDAGAVVNYPAPILGDSCPGTTVESVPPSGTVFPVGTTTVTCTALDANDQPSGSCSFTITVLPLADLALSKSAVLNNGRGGKTITYTLTLLNSGPATARGVVINDPIPSGTVFASAGRAPAVGSLSPPAVGAGGTVSWSLGNVSPGVPHTLTLVVKVIAKGSVTITNTATASSITPDPNPTNNSAAVDAIIGGGSR